MITINLELLDYFFPQERPLEAEIWNIAVLFSLGKKLILDCRNRTNLNNIVEKMNKRACVTHGPCLLVGAYSFSASAEACFLPAVAAVVPCLRASLLAPLLGGIAGGVRLCCPLGQSKTERVARPPHRGQLPPPYRNWGQLLLPSRGGARHVLLCYECFIPWAFSLLWTKPPRLGVKVPADRRLNAQRSCRRRRRVQRARDSHLRQWQIIARNLSVFLYMITHVFSRIPTRLETLCTYCRWSWSWRGSASCNTFASGVQKYQIDFDWCQQKQPSSLRPANTHKESENSELQF